MVCSINYPRCAFAQLPLTGLLICSVSYFYPVFAIVSMASNGPPQTVARFFFIPSLFRGSYAHRWSWFGSVRGFFSYSFMPTGEHPIVIQLCCFASCVCVCMFFTWVYRSVALIVYYCNYCKTAVYWIECDRLCYCCTGRGSSSVCKGMREEGGIFLLFFFVGFSSIIICCCVDYGYYYCLVREL